MTSDDIIALHKVTQNAIAERQVAAEALAELRESGRSLDAIQLTHMVDGLNSAIMALAVVQRDLLAAMLGE